MSDDEQIDKAINLIRKDYWTSVRSFADEIVQEARERIRDGEIREEDELNEWVYDQVWQTVDGSQWVIYNRMMLLVLLATDNDDAWEDMGELPSEHWNAIQTMAFYAMRADMEERVGAYRDELVEALEEDEDED